MVPPSRTDYGLWAFVIGPSPQAHLGRTASPKELIGLIRRECVDHIVVFGEAHCAGSWANTPPTIMRPERTGRWTKMRLSHAQFSGSEVFAPIRSSADYITIPRPLAAP